MKRKLQQITEDADAQYELGIIYCIRNNPKEARYWLLRAASNGHRKALEFLKELLGKKLV